MGEKSARNTPQKYPIIRLTCSSLVSFSALGYEGAEKIYFHCRKHCLFFDASVNWEKQRRNSSRFLSPRFDRGGFTDNNRGWQLDRTRPFLPVHLNTNTCAEIHFWACFCQQYGGSFKQQLKINAVVSFYSLFFTPSGFAGGGGGVFSGGRRHGNILQSEIQSNMKRKVSPAKEQK